MRCQPAAERAAGDPRQRRIPVNAEHVVDSRTQQPVAEESVGEGGNGAEHPADRVGPVE